MSCIDHGRKGTKEGYATAWLNGKSTTLHRKVFIEATGIVPEVVEHTCNNPRCINPDHLKAGTHKSNAEYRTACGRGVNPVLKGESNGRSVLTDADCATIRSLYVKGSRDFGLPALAKRFGVGTSQVHRVIKGMQRECAA